MNSPTRFDINIAILDKLYYYLRANPDIRFGQALSNLNLATHRVRVNIDGLGEKDYLYDDIFYEEPEETLTKMRQL